MKEKPKRKSVRKARKPSTSEFGQKLRDLRASKGITQRKLAEDVSKELRRKNHHEIGYTYVCKIESGAKDPPTPEVVSAISKILGGDEFELLCIAGRMPKPVSRLFAKSKSFVEIVRKSIEENLGEREWAELLAHLSGKTAA